VSHGTGDGTLTNPGNIAHFDTTANTWHALSRQGFDNQIRALATTGSGLNLGDFFSQTGDGTLTSLGSIARYDLVANSWHALPNQGLNELVETLAVMGSDLYVGGWFTHTGDGTLTDLGGIVRGTSGTSEIQVMDRATNIPDGAGRVDFGATTACTPIDKTLTVSNTGTADLTLIEPISVAAGFSEDTLELRYWDGSQSSSGGITMVSRDTVNHKLVVTIDHLSQFALFGEARKGVYLPVVMD
jgi:hypothetical protein